MGANLESEPRARPVGLKINGYGRWIPRADASGNFLTAAPVNASPGGESEVCRDASVAG